MSKHLRSPSLVLVAFVGSLACGGASPSIARTASEPTPAPGVPDGPPPHLTHVAPARDAECPGCFEVTGLPAISTDGRSIAALVELPTFYEQDGGAFEASAYAFLLLDASTGAERSRVVLLDRDDIEIDRTTLTDCCADDVGDCDPDLCAVDPALDAVSTSERRDRLEARLVQAHAWLDATTWRALTAVPTELASSDDDEERAPDDTTPIEIALYVPDAAEADAPIFDVTFAPSATCPACVVRGASAYRDALTDRLLVVVILTDDRGGATENAEARCFVQPATAVETR